MADDRQQEPRREGEDDENHDDVFFWGNGRGDEPHNNLFPEDEDDLPIFVLNDVGEDENLPQFLRIPREVNDFVINHWSNIQEDEDIPRLIPIPRGHEIDEDDGIEWLFLNNGEFGENYIFADVNNHFTAIFGVRLRETGDGFLILEPHIMRSNNNADADAEDDVEDEEGEADPMVLPDVQEEVENVHQSPLLPPDVAFQAQESPDQQLQQVEETWAAEPAGLSSTKRKCEESCEPQPSKRRKVSSEEHPDDATPSISGLSSTERKSEESCEPQPSKRQKVSSEEHPEEATPSTSGLSSTKKKSEESCEPQPSKRRKVSSDEHPDDATPSTSGLSSVRKSSQDEDEE